jgi:indolepyruvate ferredoxin oxidoreductase
VFGLLARLKFLRGTVFDPFGRTDERKMERQLIVDYEKTIGELIDTLNSDNHALAVKIASIPEQIRGYGHVKEDHVEKAQECEAGLLDSWRSDNSKKEAA